MTPEIDLDAYFTRIGYDDGDRAATLPVLAALHVRHPKAIPFENITPFLGQSVLLDPADLERKIVQGGRGGYCFEQNLLFLQVLRQLGFQVTGLAARVLWDVPDETIMPRTHMLLKIDIDGVPYIADVGFGGMVMTGPLRLDVEGPQSTPHEDYRIVPSGATYILQANVRDAWTSLHRFDLQEQHRPDYELANYFVSTHPQSRFTKMILCARVDENRRYALFNDELAIHDRRTGTEKRKLATGAELRSALENELAIDLSALADVDIALARLVEASAQV